MKIAYYGVKGLPSKEGAGRVVEGLATELATRHEITVFCNSRHVFGTEAPDNINRVIIPVPKGKYLQPFVYALLSAGHLIFNNNYDIVHLHNIENCFTLPLLRLRYRVISTSHGSAYARQKWGKAARALMQIMELPFIFLSNLRTSVSKPLADYYENKYGKDVFYIPNGVDACLQIDDQTAEKILTKFGAPQNDYVLFAAGRIDPTKGCHLLLKALPKIPEDVYVVVVGDTSHAKGYSEVLKGLADERVVFIPFVESKAALFGIIRRCKVFVFPSTIEAMSMMLLEVASLGVPMVYSDIPENKAVMPSESISFTSGDYDDLGHKILWVFENHDWVRTVASNTQAWVSKNYSWSKISMIYSELYESICA